MKIGVLTYHRSYNYGAVLQAFALKTYIESRGHEVEFIDYWPHYRSGMYDLFNFNPFKKKLNLKNISHGCYEFLKGIFYFFPKHVRYNKFQKFIKENLGVDYERRSFKEGEEIPDIYDAYIFGSDQIWRYGEFELASGFDPVYWGEFPKNAKGQKFAYAASMGVMELNNAKIDFISDKIKYFNEISVREEQLKEIIEPFYNKPVFRVLDPVFLLDKETWEEYASKNLKTPERYLLLYNIGNSKSIYDYSKNIASSINIKLIEISGSINFKRFFLKSSRQTIGPKEFIELIKNAELVVSSSFHGVAFSLIFKKQFYALQMGNNAERVKSLLRILGVEDRYITFDTGLDLNKQINYEKVNLLLEIEKKNSMQYLFNNLKD